MASQDPLVSIDWLLDNFEAPDLKVVDATWAPGFMSGRRSGRASYEDAHIEGAVYFDIDDIADPGAEFSHTLPSPVLFSSKVRRLGLGDGHRIVVYDANGIFSAARVWWMFRTMGHQDVWVLDGSLQSWIDAGGAVSDDAPVSSERHFTPRMNTSLVRALPQMQKLAETPSETILDARSPGRFDGSASEPRAGLPSGHIPGSKNLPASGLLGPDGKMKSKADLEPLLAPHLETGNLVTTCGSGVSAAIIALAYARLGRWDVSVYDGSWVEWASDPSNPIAKNI